MVITSLKSGIAQLWTNKRLIIVFYLTNLLFSVILMLPVRIMLSKFAGYSLMSTRIASRLDYDFLFEFFEYNDVTPIIMGFLLIVPAAYWLFMLFLSGGAFSVFAGESKYVPALFWANAAKYFARFIRLILWCLPVFALLFCLQFLWTGIERTFFGRDPYQYITFWGGWIQVGLRYISILLCWLVFDYARIYTVITDEQNMRKSLWQGISIVFKNIKKTFSLTLLLFIIGVLALIIYNPLANLLAAPHVIIVILLFLLQQIFIFFKMILRLTLYSSQLHFYNALVTKYPTLP